MASTRIALIAALVLSCAGSARAELTYPVGLPLEPAAVPPFVQHPPPAAAEAAPRAPDQYTLPASAVSPSDTPEHFPVRHGRFSKVPAYLAPIYERAARDYQIPVRYLAADGSYETHFHPELGDGGRSCGIHQFYANSRRVPWPMNWGFTSVAHCMEPEANIRKAAESWSTWREELCRGSLRCAIQRHNSSARGYAAAVMSGGDRYYQ